MNKYWFIIVCFLLPLTLPAQDSLYRKRPVKTVGTRKAMGELSSSLEQNKPDDEIAAEYEQLAKEFIKEGEHVKALDYLERARKLYEKLQDVEKQAVMEREIARIEELQNNIDAAVERYHNASQLSQSTLWQQLNSNDAQRLSNRKDPLVSVEFIQRNIDLSESSGQKTERAFALQQMADANIQMDKKEEAIGNLQAALQDVKDSPSQQIQLGRRIAEVYVADSQSDKAIEVLRDAYELAVQEGRTLDAKKNLELQVELYQKNKNDKKAIDLYADFIARLEPLVKSDSSLIDDRFFQVHEERIARLENERVLTAQMMRKTSKFNTILLILMLLLLIAVLLIYRFNRSIIKNNKRIALQSLRREMNPHFIFNSLNSVNQFIAQNNELEANKYLTSYSRLMRNILENSNKDFTPLASEIDQLKEYLDLEHMRFCDKFDYCIHIDDTLDAESIRIPNMLIQPQLENAIWHGLRYQEEKGVLTLSFELSGRKLKVTVEDNGIGIRKSHELKTSHQKNYQSRGLGNTRERIRLLNSLYRTHIRMDIHEKDGEETGVIVTFTFPLN